MSPKNEHAFFGHALGPPQLADGLEALQVIDEFLDVDHRP
jgi:hypothetical protein